MPPVVFLLALAVFAQGTSEFMLAGLLPDIATDLRVSVPTAGLLTSAFAIGMVVGAPLMAVAGRRRSPRWTLSMFLTVFLGMHVIAALSNNFTVLLATRVVAAFCNAGFLAVTLSVVAALVPADRTARALAVILGGTTLALVAGVPGGAAVGGLLGWRAALWGVAALCVPALVAVLVFTPARSGAGDRTFGPLRPELGDLRRRSLLVPLALGALVNGATFCAFTYLTPLITAITGGGSVGVAVVLAVFGLGASAGVWAAGRLGDRHPVRLLVLCGGALLMGWVVFAVLSNYLVAVITLAFLQGGLSFAVGSTLIALAMKAAADAATMSGAFATASLNIGAAIGPVVGGLAYASSLGKDGPLIVSAALVLAAGLLLRRLSPMAAPPR